MNIRNVNQVLNTIKFLRQRLTLESSFYKLRKRLKKAMQEIEIFPRIIQIHESAIKKIRL